MTASLLPPNATPLERAVEAPATRLDAVPVPIDTLWSPERCPAPLLPWLAWAVSIDAWDAAWPDAVKHRVIAASFDVHRHKGTLGAVRRVLRALGATAAVSEWWQQQPPGAPHTFDLLAMVNENISPLGQPVLSPRLYAALQAAVNAVKPARSHYAFRVGVGFERPLAAAGAASGWQGLRLGMTPDPHHVRIDGGLVACAAGGAGTAAVRCAMRPDTGFALTAQAAAAAAGLGVTLLRAAMEA